MTMNVDEMNGLYSDIMSLVKHIRKHPRAEGAQKLLLDNIMTLDYELRRGAPTPDPWTRGFKVSKGRMTPTGRLICDKPPISY